MAVEDYTIVVHLETPENTGKGEDIEYMSTSVNFNTLPTRDSKGNSGIQLLFQDDNKRNSYVRTIPGGECSIGPDNQIILTVDNKAVLLRKVFPDISNWIFKNGPTDQQRSRTRGTVVKLLAPR